MRNPFIRATVCGVHEPHVIKVVLRDLDGRFLAGHTGAWTFTADPKAAHVFDYIADRIPEQLEALERQHGLVLIPIALDPRDHCEICDCCGRRVMSVTAFFDGSQYLCPDCRQKKSFAEAFQPGSAP